MSDRTDRQRSESTSVDHGDTNPIEHEETDSVKRGADGSAIDRDRRALLATAGGLLAGVAGCVGNPWEPGAEEEPNPSPTETGTGGGTGDDPTGDNGPNGSGNGDTGGDATDGGTDGDDPNGGGQPPEPDLVVAVGDGDFRFDPDQFEIEAGQTVRWVWHSGGHNVVPDSVPDGVDWGGSAGGGTDTYGEGHELISTFDVPGQYDYYCAAHRSLGMEGSFTVVDS